MVVAASLNNSATGSIKRGDVEDGSVRQWRRASRCRGPLWGRGKTTARHSPSSQLFIIGDVIAVSFSCLLARPPGQESVPA